MRHALITTAAVLAAVVLFLVATLPPAPEHALGTIDPALERRTVAGAFHVHSNRSDGAAGKSEIAAAASRAGLRFVVFSEHGDGTRPPDPPAYLGGVLCLDAVEISTNGGHYVALDMPAAPYPLGGEPDTVVEDVRRLGGFGVAAHPDSPKPELAWAAWDLPFDGLEWLNADSEWRDETQARLVRAALDYFVRSGPALASLLDRAAVLPRWDALTAHRPVVGLAGHDAHGGIMRLRDDGSPVRVIGVPSYEATFKSFAIRVIVPQPLTGAAQQDGRLLLDAIRMGRVFTAIDGTAAPALLDFHAPSPEGEVAMGATVPFNPSLEFEVRATLPADGRLVLLRDGSQVAEAPRGELRFRPQRPGVYRVEAHLRRERGTPPVPWIVSNPIYLRASAPGSSSRAEVVEPSVPLMSTDWHIEKDSSSGATMWTTDGKVTLQYRLGRGRPSTFAAIVAALPAPLPRFDRVVFEARSSLPGRISVQFRFDGGERWLRSAYVSPDARRVVLRTQDFRHAERTAANRSDLSAATSLLFVVDLTNSLPGSAGAIDFTHVALASSAK